ncbi:ABC transporter ATP-binding protein [Agrococcus sp. KRD186]|jgi:ABC-type lipoprotein export system ATPase subunit|uniref:ABC transporter ATP-binding protein n=1 Tax=Agrococcus sp. KRD186 TaxID=2729730 RepID=UPI0019D00631|nr:ATP-binding cassette domain-containing protein [Agrococcus sp. KRD186]
MTTTDTAEAASEVAATHPVLALDGVTIAYPVAADRTVTVIEGYDLVLEAGGFHCLAGRSGSGKTSVLRVAAGLANPTEGSVAWAGDAIAELSPHALADRRNTFLGYLDQGGELLPGLTALENVLLPAVPTRAVKRLTARAVELLEHVGVDHRMQHTPDRLSGGERQRVALARALLMEPAVVVADEPTASLDRESADTVIELLAGLVDHGVAVLVAAHDPGLIAAAGSVTRLD